MKLRVRAHQTSRKSFAFVIFQFNVLNRTLYSDRPTTVSMLVAAVTRYGSMIEHPNESFSVYGLLDSVFLSSFTVFPAFVLQSLSYELRRRRIRLFLWFLVLAFAIAVDILYEKKFVKALSSENNVLKIFGNEKEIGQYVWFALCQDLALSNSLRATVKAGHVVMIINCSWWVYYVIASLGGRKWTPAFEKRTELWAIWGKLRLWLRLGNGLLCVTLMWVFLGLFTVYRSDVTSRADSADQDNQWMFGQVLALATFVPVGIDLVVVYICKF